MTTGITPQDTTRDGVSESEFCREFLDRIATPGTVFVGYNNIRFDDEFMRNTLWRNFHDPYEWAWSEDRGRWDMLDVARMTRALRPEGIMWPYKRTRDATTSEWVDKPTVNLVDMAKNNGFENENAHDALADVNALINLTKLLREKQPKLFQYLLDHRDKASVAGIVRPDKPIPFVYTSGRYPSENEKTSVAIIIARGRTSGSALVWDLRYNIADFDWDDARLRASLTADREARKAPSFIPVPIKELAFNRCPAVAPIGVLDEASGKRINLPQDRALANWRSLRQHPEIIARVVNAWRERPPIQPASDVEGRLYDGFLPKSDANKVRLVAAADESELADLHPEFSDSRMSELLLRYKARQYPRALSQTEQAQWEQYRANKLKRELPKYFEELGKLARDGADDYLIQEMQLWAESIVPGDSD